MFEIVMNIKKDNKEFKLKTPVSENDMKKVLIEMGFSFDKNTTNLSFKYIAVKTGCDIDFATNDPYISGHDLKLEHLLKIEQGNIAEINNLAKTIAKIELSNNDYTLLKILLENTHSYKDVVDIINNIDNYTFYPDMSMEDIAMMYVARNYQLDSFIKRNINYEQMGVELEMEGNYIVTYYGVVTWK